MGLPVRDLAPAIRSLDLLLLRQQLNLQIREVSEYIPRKLPHFMDFIFYLAKRDSIRERFSARHEIYASERKRGNSTDVPAREGWCLYATQREVGSAD
jgi:hypothetical protein